MNDTIKSLFGYIFSFGMFMFLFMSGFVYLMVYIINHDNARNDANRAKSAYCFDQGMVLVRTDAGDRCVDPANLVQIK
jgi:hypothetical protein